MAIKLNRVLAFLVSLSLMVTLSAVTITVFGQDSLPTETGRDGEEQEEEAPDEEEGEPPGDGDPDGGEDNTEEGASGGTGPEEGTGDPDGADGGQDPDPPGDQGGGDGEEEPLSSEEGGEGDETSGEDGSDVSWTDNEVATIDYLGQTYHYAEIGTSEEFITVLTRSYANSEHKRLYIKMTDSFGTGPTGDLYPGTGLAGLVVDGDNRQHTLTETRNVYCGPDLKEIHMRDVRILGSRALSLFSGGTSYAADYHYTNVEYTGPQMIYNRLGNAYITDCTISTTAEEVAEVVNITLGGRVIIHHDSPHSVFWNFLNGTLLLTQGTYVEVTATSRNPYVIHPETNGTDLILEDGAAFVIRGSTARFTRNAGHLSSIYLGRDANIDWESDQAVSDAKLFVTGIKLSGAADPAIYLAEGASMRVVSTGATNIGDHNFVRVGNGSVILESGARMELVNTDFQGNVDHSPIHLANGHFRVGNGGSGATLIVNIGNTQTTNYGLIRMPAPGARFEISQDSAVYLSGNSQNYGLIFMGSTTAGSFTMAPGSIFVGHATGFSSNGGAVSINGAGSSVVLNRPHYFETNIGGGNAKPFMLHGTGTVALSDVQQINHWTHQSATYLGGAVPQRRWLAAGEEGSFSVTANVSANNTISPVFSGELDDAWNIGPEGFGWNGVQLFSAGTVNAEVTAVEYDRVQGSLLLPDYAPHRLGLGDGAVQLLRRTEGQAEQLSAVTDATPGFSITPTAELSQADRLELVSEYRYLFAGSLPVDVPGPPLSMVVPELLQFPKTAVSESNTTLHTVEEYRLQVIDRRGALASPWRVEAAFEGFRAGARVLNGLLRLGAKELGPGNQEIVSDSGTQTYSLDPELFVPGGAAYTGEFEGVILWQLVDAP